MWETELREVLVEGGYPRFPGNLAGKMTEQLNEQKNPRGE